MPNVVFNTPLCTAPFKCHVSAWVAISGKFETWCQLSNLVLSTEKKSMSICKVKNVSSCHELYVHVLQNTPGLLWTRHACSFVGSSPASPFLPRDTARPLHSFPCHLSASENTCSPYGSTLVAAPSPADRQNALKEWIRQAQLADVTLFYQSELVLWIVCSELRGK